MTMPTLLMQRAHDEAVGDDPPRLVDKPRRRSFSAEYKLAILAEYDGCVGDGDKGALLRREGLYSSHVVEWRRARDNAARSGLAAQPKAAKTNPDTAALAKANRRIERLEADLAKHKLALDIAGKAHALLEMLAESATDDTPGRGSGSKPTR
jgi:transposase